MNLRFALRARKFRSKRDPAEIEWILEHTEPGGVAFDIGAHKGGWTYWMRKVVGPHGQVFAFEPQAELHAYLQRIFVSPRWQNVRVENVALSSERGSGTLFIPDGRRSHSPAASLNCEIAAQENETREARVQVTTLDHYVREQALSRVDLVKVDVEGWELNLLAGAQSTLKNQQANWIIESEARHIGKDRVLQLFDVMHDAGYAGFFFYSGDLRPLVEFSFEAHQSREGERFWDQPHYCNNFLFTKD